MTTPSRVRSRFLTTLAAGVILGATALGLTACDPSNLGSSVGAGTSITAGQFLVSPDGAWKAIVQKDGNFVLYQKGVARWSVGTGTTGSRLTMQTDGNLVLYNNAGAAKWKTNTSGQKNTLHLQNDGNLVVRLADGRPTWSRVSGPTGHTPAALPTGGSLGVGQSLVSPDGAWKAVVQSDGNFVLYQKGVARWSVGTGTTGSRLTMQTDGNLVLYNNTGAAKWNSNTQGRGHRLLLQNDGNLVIYLPDGRPVWSRTTGRTGHTESILGTGGSLRPVQQLVSPDGRWRAVMQGDGNFVVYGPTKAEWVVGTGTANSTLIMQTDGNLVLYNNAGAAKWNSRTQGANHRLVLQNDGNLVVYAPGGLAVWDRTRPAGGPIGDDYPAHLKAAAKDALMDPWGFYNRECTSFVAWRMNNANKMAFTNTMAGGQFGNANTWDDNARRLGYRVDSTPAVGAIAQSDAGGWGHVAWVAKVNGDGTIVIEEYNQGLDGRYGTRTVSAGSFRYLHLRDLS